MQIATLLNDPKYIWLSSNNYGGNGPQLPNGELPLFCWKHPNTEKIQVVILCEGALKSMLVALFLWRQGQYDIAVIGAATAARYGEKTLEDYLKRLGAKDIQLMPDAGAVANPHINQANCQTLE
jgi:rhodanese-related sulfurtransferase